MCANIHHLSPPLDRFLFSVNKDGPLILRSRCWIWTRPLNHNGYGQFMVKGKVLRVHRYAYAEFIGTIPTGLDVLHKCDTRNCVNPKHLFLGTTQINQADKVRKNRQAKGETNGFAKLTEEEVRLIRKLYAKKSGYHDPIHGQGGLAKRFNVTQANISLILKGRGWKHVSR